MSSPLRALWLRWKALPLPWRKRFLRGQDLQGNTFWEFRDTHASHQHRMRRIVQYPRSTPLSDVAIAPQWHQWLRHMRPDPPSIAEQSQDLVRQEQLKVLARQADERWAAKASYLDKPKAERSELLGVGRGRNGMEDIARGMAEGRGSAVTEPEPQTSSQNQPDTTTIPLPSQAQQTKPEREDPWKQARGGPSEEWQPAAWNAGKATARR